ncbi:hypothetical protein NQ317_009057 [Molorchus minor]|uniref:NADH:ubiquinone oxidoreductase intermediate-associated protein 30 domain-containing protein n=1 Tax=Molorchus minor TaxID=1323400 RepID=A0ABQ9J1J0_9CUCU|nr:hypothetical protein NQ317_009057 [Molorchus minor]
MEHSDSVMPHGKSKSSFVMIKTDLFKRAVLFTLLNPQSCGAALAGIRKAVSMDISNYQNISMKIRGQGQYKGYKFFMWHKGHNGSQAPSDFDVVNLPIQKFQLYLEGVHLKTGEPLDRTQITSMGILAYGGAHSLEKQHGAAALEIDWLKLE